MLKIKIPCSEVVCESCGKIFMQTRNWSVYCCTQCRRSGVRSAVNSLRAARHEIKILHEEIQSLKRNALTHSGAYQPSNNVEDDNQEHWLGQ